MNFKCLVIKLNISMAENSHYRSISVKQTHLFLCHSIDRSVLYSFCSICLPVFFSAKKIYLTCVFQWLDIFFCNKVKVICQGQVQNLILRSLFQNNGGYKEIFVSQTQLLLIAIYHMTNFLSGKF